jgi:alkylation response protein AidB-like acyl-CoA dehydrogenase
VDFAWTEEQEILRQSVRTLMRRHAPPDYVRRHDQERAFPYDLYQHWIDAGLLRLPFPEAYGGLDGTALDLAIVVEEISRISADFCMVFSGNIFCGLNILRHGTEAQREHWLPRLLDGRIMLSIGISEPDAGSDVGAIRTSARRDGDDWVINGQKLWTTGAGLRNSLMCLYVRTDPKANHRAGLSLILVENDTPGVELRKLDMLGRRCAGTYEVFLDDVRVSADRLIGEENKGWDCLLSGLQFERAVSAAGNCGGAQAIFDLALEHSKQRRQFGRAIGEFQTIAHRLADMQTQLDAARVLTWRAAWKAAQGVDALADITMAKLFSSETYVQIANAGMQIAGAFGLSAESDMQRHFRDSRSVTIAAGTSEMQRNVLAGLMGLRSR